MDTKNNNKIFTYLIVMLVVLALGLYLKNQSKPTPPAIETPKEDIKKDETKISIKKEEIKEENFSATVSKISGDSTLAVAARSYVEKSIADFKKDADNDVPDMRLQFGSDSPTTNYTIEIEATYVKDTKTESIVISEYVYTGGANGNSIYKVFTSSLSNGNMLALGDVIKNDKQASFTAFVKKELQTWKPEESGTLVVFEQSVKDLKFESFRNWSIQNGKLIIYFDKYEIGPGALGPVAFKIDMSKIKDYLENNY
ncbi:MAG: DUF3298 domain-containing protein [Patescibacteria group bacterium]